MSWKPVHNPFISFNAQIPHSSRYPSPAKTTFIYPPSTCNSFSSVFVVVASEHTVPSWALHRKKMKLNSFLSTNFEKNRHKIVQTLLILVVVNAKRCTRFSHRGWRTYVKQKASVSEATVPFIPIPVRLSRYEWRDVSPPPRSTERLSIVLSHSEAAYSWHCLFGETGSGRLLPL